jgi:5-methylcytosine-specific restriction endonuclease McrA
MIKINRQDVYNKYKKRCGYCSNEIITIKDMQVDHIEPQWRFKEGFVKGDMNDFSNLMPTCRTCNHYKRGYQLEEFRRLMITLHERVSSHYIAKVAIRYGIVKIKPFDGTFYFEIFKK